MTFAENLWCLPLWAPATKTRGTGKAEQPPIVLDANPFSALLTINDPEEEFIDFQACHLSQLTLPEVTTINQLLQMLCNRWCHPGSTKHMENFSW